MLTDEWNWEEYKEVALEEAREEVLELGIKEGLEKGIEQGIEKGIEQGIEKGLEQGLEQAARNLLAMGMAIDDIARATELPVEKVYALASG